MPKANVIAIVGPTASGKTAVSIEVAKRINGEIVSCDSMQIYKDMNIGTAKPTKEEMQEITHYLIGCVSPEERYSVSQYKKDATKAIETILSRGKVPIVVGGTGLYLNALVYGIDFQDIKFDEEYRKELEKIAETEEGLNELYIKAKQIDSEAIEIISPKDKKRIIRILEIYNATGKNKTQQNKESIKNGVQYNFKIFALNWERGTLYNRINLRVDSMLEQGLVEEVEALQEKYKIFPTAMQGLGYKEVVEYLNGNISKNAMIELIKMQTRRYAKRQLTWFRKNREIIWLNGEDGIEFNVEQIVKNCKVK